MLDILFLFGGGLWVDCFDDIDQFVFEYLFDLDVFFDGYCVFDGDDYVVVYWVVCDLFEVWGVYDVMFGYNFVWLNFDCCYLDVGFCYVED